MGYYTIRKTFFVDCYTSNVEQSQKIDKFLALLDRSGACDLLNSLLKEKQKMILIKEEDHHITHTIC